MLKSICILAALVLTGCLPLLGQPDLRSFALDGPTTTRFSAGSCEVPPWILGGGGDWRSYFFVDGIGSYIGSARGSLISQDAMALQHAPMMITTPLSDCLLGTGREWKRNYYAVYSAQYFDHPQQGPVTIGFLHAENKTSCSNGRVTCQNTIDVLHLQQSCGLGDDWERYNSFVCAAWIPNGPQTNWGQQPFPNDIGPIVWPSTGYLQANGEKYTCGVNTPSSIQHDGYIYLFFHDDGPYGSPNTPPFYPPVAEGRCEGIKVARAPFADALNPQAWTVFYRDPSGAETWHASMPAGFTKETITQYWNQPGPKSTDIMNDEEKNLYNEIRFSVAQVRGADYFIGVESYSDMTDPVPGTGAGTGRPPAFRVKKALRYSHDLIHWSPRLRIIETADDWSQSDLNYAVLLGSDGWSNNLVDSTDFYVVGTNSVIGNTVNKVHVYLPGVTRSEPVVRNASTTLLTDTLGPLTAVYPNPGHGLYRLGYSLARNTTVQLNVLDLGGRRLATGPLAPMLPGHHVEDLDIARFGKGIFLLELLVDGRRHVYKVVDE